MAAMLWNICGFIFWLFGAVILIAMLGIVAEALGIHAERGPEDVE